VRIEKCGGEKQGEAAWVYIYGGEALTESQTNPVLISITYEDSPSDIFVEKARAARNQANKL